MNKSKETPKSHLDAPPPFTNGDLVRRKYHTEVAGMIVGTVYRLGGLVTYLVNWGDEEMEHEHHAEELKASDEFVERPE